MSKLVFNRDGGKTDEFGHLLALMRFIQGEVIEGLQVAANGTPNMSVNVPYGVAAIPTGSGATAYRYFVGLDATENVTIPTANGSNPRNDLIVLWVDKSVTPNQVVTNNSNNMLKISVVSGTPASTPADPNTAAIQAAIGASNPYIILARVVTGAGVTQINSGNITDLRSLTGVTRVLADMVGTAAIQNLAVTTGKLADNAVTAIKIATNAVTPDKIDRTNWPMIQGTMSGLSPVPTTASVRASYTIPAGASGKYRIHASFQWNQNGENVIKDYTGRILKNGSLVRECVWTALQTSYLNVQPAFVILDLVAGDVIDFAVVRASPAGGSVSSASAYTIERIA